MKLFKCPVCGWYLFSINKELALYECCNKQCCSILQASPLLQKPKDREIQNLEVYA